MWAVERVKEYVRAGDVFQVNISQRFEVPFGGDPLALYGALRRRNPSPFGGCSPFPASWRSLARRSVSWIFVDGGPPPVR